MSETIVVWLLSIQLWTDVPSKMQFIYNQEFPTYEECMKEREEWLIFKEHTVLCLLKTKPIKK